MSINPKDVSVVVQGAIDPKNTILCLRSIKECLPGSEIILSTWEGTDISALDTLYDKVAFSACPEAYEFQAGQKNNMNRQIISTQAGLKLVTRKYVLKLRSDLELLNDKIIHLEDSFKRVDNLRLFKQRIYTHIIFSFKYETDGVNKHYRPFQFSDWWFFGLAEDVKTLFDVPLVKEPDFSYYFKTHSYQPNKFIYYKQLTWKMTAEQYIHSSCAKKHFPQIKFDDLSDYNDTNIKQSEIYAVNNFHFCDTDKSGIRILKPAYEQFQYKRYACNRDTMYRPMIWLLDYKKYIDPTYHIGCWFKLADTIQMYKWMIRLPKWIGRICCWFIWKKKNRRNFMEKYCRR